MSARPLATPPLPHRHSLVAQTVESLCAGIRSGYWREHLPGERELGERLGVSRRTIGAALLELQRQGWIETAQRQRRRIARRPARARGGGPRRSIAILSASPMQGMPQQTLVMLDALKEQFTRAGYALEFHINPACFSAHPARALQKLVREKPASVWLQLGSSDPTQAWFAEQGIPCLLLGTGHAESPLPSIDCDHRAACRHAGGLLLRRGHLHLAIVLPQGRRGGDAASEAGVREAIAQHRGARLRVLRHDGTAAHLCSVLDSTLREPAPPTAYVVARPMHALTVMMHLMRRGRRIPEDVAVIARDDDTYLQAASPSLARYAVDPAALARRVALAGRQLAEAGTLRARAIRLMPAFVPGGSV